MANVVVTYKIFPTGIEVDFEDLHKQIEKGLPSQARLFGNYQTEPIAFGLNALITHIQIPEDQTGVLEAVEKAIENIPTVSQIQTLMVRRAR
ncbi:MAG: elongation factor 1-beta [Candidatus Bathyarchaeota archaeon]|nr:MAG: elongation factor 1-beta [Candidatus Bathyarchaeota archaeon]